MYYSLWDYSGLFEKEEERKDLRTRCQNSIAHYHSPEKISFEHSSPANLPEHGGSLPLTPQEHQSSLVSPLQTYSFPVENEL
jgi:hypothetical protein